jgi:hypothetical protein
VIETNAVAAVFGAHRGGAVILQLMGDTPQGGDERQDRRQYQEHSSFPNFQEPMAAMSWVALLVLGDQLTEVIDWSWEVARLTSF